MIEPMRIIQVAPYFYPHVGGVESYVLCLSRELVKLGHDVTVYTSNHHQGIIRMDLAWSNRGKQFEKGSGRTRETKDRRKLSSTEILDGVKIRRIKPVANIFTTPLMPKLKKILLRESADIVNAHSPPPFSEYFAARACKETDTPFVITYHCDLEIPVLMGPALCRLYELSFGLYALSHADRIIATTTSYSSTSRAVWGYDPVVVPNAVDTEKFRPDIECDEVRTRHGLENFNIGLYVGRLKFHKGLEYLVESAKYLDKNTKYLIVGEGDFKSELLRRIKILGLEDTVILAGAVPDEELPRYYAASDVFILPSVTRLEAFGIVGLEAMASGKPVIISDIPGVREVITDGVEGVIVEPVNSRDIAEKVNMLISDKDRCRKMGARGRKKVLNKYQWSKVAKTVEKIYTDLAS